MLLEAAKRVRMCIMRPLFSPFMFIADLNEIQRSNKRRLTQVKRTGDRDTIEVNMQILILPFLIFFSSQKKKLLHKNKPQKWLFSNLRWEIWSLSSEKSKPVVLVHNSSGFQASRLKFWQRKDAGRGAIRGAREGLLKIKEKSGFVGWRI